MYAIIYTDMTRANASFSSRVKLDETHEQANKFLNLLISKYQKEGYEVTNSDYWHAVLYNKQTAETAFIEITTVFLPPKQ